MIGNHYRNKLLLAFWGLALFMSALIGGVMVLQSRASLMEQIRSNVLSIAVIAASQVNGDQHETIREPGDEAGEAYRQIENRLRALRDLNRREDTYVEFIYTMRRVSERPDEWVYVVDAEEAGEDKSEIGEVMTWEGQGDPGDERLKLGEAYAEEEFTRDEYGVWLSANAPVRNSDGEIVAMVGVDLRAADVQAKIDALLHSALLGFLVAITLGSLLSYLLARVITRPLEVIVEAIDRIGRGRFGTRIPTSRRDEFAKVSRAVNQMAESLQERDALKGALSRYVSSDIGKRLIEEKKLPVLEGERQEMTILYCDSENISVIAEKFPPRRAVEILNDYYARMVDIIFRHQGTLDRNGGRSGLIAVFGAPLADASRERNAIKAANDMQGEQARLNEKWGLTGETAFSIGIGIHTGEAVLGNIGADHQQGFTVLGSSVDIAILIEGRRRELKSATVISETAVEPVRGEFSFREIGDIQLPDWADFLRLYTLPLNRVPSPPSP